MTPATLARRTARPYPWTAAQTRGATQCSHRAAELLVGSDHKFWGKAEIQVGGCWLWRGGSDPWGYGRHSAGGKRVCAHRHAYALTIGPIPADHVVGHHCDTPACINPEHLFTGTQSENMVDMSRKGRNGSKRGHQPRHRRGDGKHCGYGHPLTEENRYVRARGSFECRACRKAQKRRRIARIGKRVLPPSPEHIVEPVQLRLRRIESTPSVLAPSGAPQLGLHKRVSEIGGN